MAPALRAASWSFLTFGTVSMPLGRTPQFRLAMSRISNAVVLASTETGFSSGTGGVLTVFHSEMMSEADNVMAPNKTTAMTPAAAAVQQDTIRAFLIDVLPLIEAEYYSDGLDFSLQILTRHQVKDLSLVRKTTC